MSSPAKVIDARQGAFKKPWQRWVPLLCLYTGARLNEVCQLRTVDVQEEAGVAYLDITPKAGRLKNLASKRPIPLHPKLIEWGFLDYVASRRAALAERVFDLRERRDGRGATASRWWGYWRKKHGISAQLHGARHSFSTCLSYAAADQTDIAQLLGHSRGAGETQRYCNPSVQTSCCL